MFLCVHIKTTRRLCHQKHTHTQYTFIYKISATKASFAWLLLQYIYEAVSLREYSTVRVLMNHDITHLHIIFLCELCCFSAILFPLVYQPIIIYSLNHHTRRLSDFSLRTFEIAKKIHWSHCKYNYFHLPYIIIITMLQKANSRCLINWLSIIAYAISAQIHLAAFNIIKLCVAQFFLYPIYLYHEIHMIYFDGYRLKYDFLNNIENSRNKQKNIIETILSRDNVEL